MTTRQVIYQQRKASGVCTQCGRNPPATPGLRCAECIEKQARQARDKYTLWKQGGVCTRCGKAPQNIGLLCITCRTYINQYEYNRTTRLGKANPRKVARRIYADKIKRETFSHYGGKCACCGESGFPFLTLDHINGDGAKHRRALFGRQIGGFMFYCFLKKQGWPEGYQVLCYNCNCAKGDLPDCPHKMGYPFGGNASEKQ